MAKQLPPVEVAERFLPRESPTFTLLRRVGQCRLWRSKTVAHEVHGRMRPARVHYHVAVGEEAQLVLIGKFRTALLNFHLSVGNPES